MTGQVPLQVRDLNLFFYAGTYRSKGSPLKSSEICFSEWKRQMATEPSQYRIRSLDPLLSRVIGRTTDKNKNKSDCHRNLIHSELSPKTKEGLSTNLYISISKTKEKARRNVLPQNSPLSNCRPHHNRYCPRGRSPEQRSLRPRLRHPRAAHLGSRLFQWRCRPFLHFRFRPYLRPAWVPTRRRHREGRGLGISEL